MGSLPRVSLALKKQKRKEVKRNKAYKVLAVNHDKEVRNGK
jgi:hypothetical protein